MALNWSVFLLLLSSLWNGGYLLIITIDDGNTNLTDVVARENGSNLQLNILTDLVLDSTVHFTDLNSSMLQGLHSIITITCSSEAAGFIFMRTQSVELRNLNLFGCAVLHTYCYPGGSLTFSSALHIVSANHVCISDVSIDSSPGAGLLLAYNSGISTVSHSNFTNNRLVGGDEKKGILGGGGVYLHVENSAPHSQFHFNNCNFRNNVAENTPDYSYIFVDTAGESINGRGRGGGIFVNLRDMVFNNTVIISECSFVDNIGFVGSGISAEIENKNSSSNTILVEDCEIIHNGYVGNGSSRWGSGGGAQVSYRTMNFTNNRNNLIKFSNVTFRENSALLGGGTYFYSDHNIHSDTNNQIVFEQCRWIENHAHIGAAVDITPDIFERSKSGYGSVLVFRDCQFINNSIEISYNIGKQQDYGTGTFYSSLYDVIFESSVTFRNNVGTAVHVVNAIANFRESNAVFDGNHGIQGGGIALVGTSSMLIGPYNYSFIDNVATDKGGAIFSTLMDSHDFQVSRSCFLQYSENSQSNRILPSTKWKARLLFKGNFAHSRHGNDIFTTSLLPCQVVNQGDTNNMFEVLEIDKIFQPPGVTFQDSADGISISTEGAQFSTNYGHLRIIPGEEYHHQISVIDDLEQTTETALIPSFLSRTDDILLEDSSTCLTNQVIQLGGEPGSTDTLLLQAKNSRKIFLTLSVELLECPPGFILKELECVCDALSHTALVRCDNDRLQSFLRTGFWAGYVNISTGSRLVTTICPLGFCNYYSDYRDANNTVVEVELPRSREELVVAVCGRERSGILCGTCNQGFVVHFHSPYSECMEDMSNDCRFGWLFYIVSEIIPATVLFIVILVFNISFTSGALNGFILFSQLLDSLLIDASGVISFSETVEYFIQAIRLVYGFFNLDFFYTRSLSFCIWKQASTLDLLAFKYMTIVYSVVLIIGVILFMQHCGARCLGKYYRASVLKNSVIQGLSAFLVLCYAQCIKVSFKLLYFSRLFLSPEERNTTLHRRVFYDGEMEFFSTAHLPYALPALAVLLTVGIIPPMILITYPAIFHILARLKIRDSCIDKLLPSFSTMKPFLDAFQGSFKDNFRFFAGLYFIYRWVGVLIYALISSYSVFYAVLEMMLILMLVFHTLNQPYHKKWHNILDALLFADLAAINNITALHYYASRVDPGMFRQMNIEKSSIVQVVLIYLPVVYLVIYVTVQIIMNTCKRKNPRQDLNISSRSKLSQKLNRLFTLSRKWKEKMYVEDKLEDERNVSTSVIYIRDNRM